MFDDATEISMEEVDRVLSKIENKYAPVKNIHLNDSGLEENLAVLSREFDSIGVPMINLSQPFRKVVEELISSTRCLVQIHRRTLAQLKDTNITSQSNNTRYNYLHKVVDNYQSKIDSSENRNACLQNRIEVLEDKIIDLKKRETDTKHEMEKIKRYHMEQKNEFLRKIKKLSEENRRLKEHGSEIKPHSRDEVLLNFVGKYKKNEEIYKTTIGKLEENNRQLVRNIVDVKCKETSSFN